MSLVLNNKNSVMGIKILSYKHVSLMFCFYMWIFCVFFFQTVNPREVVVEETKPDLESDTVHVPSEPEPTSDPQAGVDQQTDTQDHDQKVPVSSTPEPVSVSTDASVSAEIFSDSSAAHPSLDPNPATSPDEAENTPTSQSADPTHTR